MYPRPLKAKSRYPHHYHYQLSLLLGPADSGECNMVFAPCAPFLDCSWLIPNLCLYCFARESSSLLTEIGMNQAWLELEAVFRMHAVADVDHAIFFYAVA